MAAWTCTELVLMRQDADQLLGFVHAAPRPRRDGILRQLDVSLAGAVERRISLRRSRGDTVGGGTMPASSRRASVSSRCRRRRRRLGAVIVGRWAVPQYLHGAVVAGRQPAGLMAAGCRRRPDSHHQLDVSTVNMLEQLGRWIAEGQWWTCACNL